MLVTQNVTLRFVKERTPKFRMYGNLWWSRNVNRVLENQAKKTPEVQVFILQYGFGARKKGFWNPSEMYKDCPYNNHKTMILIRYYRERQN